MGGRGHWGGASWGGAGEVQSTEARFPPVNEPDWVEVLPKVKPMSYRDIYISVGGKIELFLIKYF